MSLDTIPSSSSESLITKHWTSTLLGEILGLSLLQNDDESANCEVDKKLLFHHPPAPPPTPSCFYWTTQIGPFDKREAIIGPAEGRAGRVDTEGQVDELL